MTCNNCHAPLENGAVFCTSCGSPVAASQPQQQQQQSQAYTQPQYQQPPFNGAPGQPPVMPVGFEQKSKLAAGLLGIFLGAYGVHNFYLGFTNKAILQLVLSIFTCGVAGLWGFIEGIMYLTGSLNVDAKGFPLKD